MRHYSGGDYDTALDVLGDDSPFKRCDECGRIVQEKRVHVCDLKEARNSISVPRNAKSREIRHELDVFDDPDEPVIMSDRQSAFTYHRPENPDDPDSTVVSERCRSVAAGKRSTRRTRQEAYDRGKIPCGSCFGHDNHAIRKRYLEWELGREVTDEEVCQHGRRF